jgi:DNA-binding MarR family transcriptional regulator
MSNARFSIIPGWIVTDARLKGRDLQVLCLLGRYTDRQGWCVRSQVKMAGQLNCARSTVQLSLDRLVSIGAVERRAGESRDGRDTSYWYRVIYDRAVAAEELDGWDDGEGDGLADEGAEQAGAALGIQSCETGESGETPADISAPPADPVSAPPADPGSAPYKNVPHITTPAERREREARERAADSDVEGKEGGDAAPAEDARATERSFRRAFPQWPTYVGDSEDAARRAWARLTPEERTEAVNRIDDYRAAAKAGGRKTICSFAVYLSEKRWEKLPPRDAEPVSTHSSEPPFGKGWGAMRLAELIQPPAPMPLPTHFIQSMIDAGGDRGERERLQHQARHGWPRVNAMHAQAAERRGFHVPVEILPLGETFRQVRRGTPLWDAWRALHERRGWPWVPDGPEWLWMPAGDDPETAVAEFKKAVKAREADDDDEAA